jgi:hypothetical protein
VQVAAGKAFDPEGSPRALQELMQKAVVPTYEGQIQIARRIGAPDRQDEELEAILRAAEEGVRQIEQDPTLLREGRVPGFQTAQRLAEEAGLAYCSPAQNPASGAEPSGVEQTPCERKSATYLKHQGGPLPLVVGCFVVAGAGQTIELSAEDERIGGRLYLCLNRRYSRIQVPSSCTPDARPERIHLLGVERPRRAVPGPMIAVGIVPVASDEVLLRISTNGGADQVVKALIEKVPPVALRSVRRRSFRYFIAALPPKACGDVFAEARSDDHRLAAPLAEKRPAEKSPTACELGRSHGNLTISTNLNDYCGDSE